jgi:hypothetical protein
MGGRSPRSFGTADLIFALALHEACEPLVRTYRPAAIPFRDAPGPAMRRTVDGRPSFCQPDANGAPVRYINLDRYVN